ncbi:hypothetical protein [Actinomadura sp. K4S16]|uniref:hypothetical protein n=1 Tax=Actinomadura sp. K4S16 TaxID=1316147 RepID=UPI0011EDCF87|nr:hypothetical protein [Actinomadura sp. K4S16]
MATPITDPQASKPSDLRDPLFVARSITAAALSRGHIAELVSGTVVALQIKDFVPADLCRAAMARIADPGFPMDRYDRARVDPPIARFGPVLNEYKEGGGLRSDYWDDIALARHVWRTWMHDADPLGFSISRLSAAWQGRLRPARISGRELFAGAIREINNGALIHFDDVRREYGHDLFDEGAPVVQLAFNVWMSVPPEGGRTHIYRHQWDPADSASRSGYGYHRNVIDGEQEIVLSVELGDALLFDPRYFHSVDPSPQGRRIAVTFFLGLNSRGELIMWS